LILWTSLKNRQVNGKRFRRQYSIGSYIVDFYCVSERLVIEVDGEIHFTEEAKKYDNYRTQIIESLGIRVLRVKNEDVLYNTDGVIRMIREALKTTPNPPAPFPLR